MANINRVVLVGNLTKDPELRHTPSGNAGLQAAHRRQHAAEGRRDRGVGRQAQLLRRHRLGQPGARAAPSTSRKGRPVGVDGRLDWREWEAQDGSKRQAVEIIADTVQFLGGRGEGRRRRRRQPVRAGRCGAGERRLPGRRRRRHSLLGETPWRERNHSSSGSVPAARQARSSAGTATSARTRSRRSTTRTSTSCGVTSPRRARSAAGASPAPAGAIRCRSPRP